MTFSSAFLSKLSSTLLVVALASTSLAPVPAEARMAGGGAKIGFKPPAAGAAKVGRAGTKVQPLKPGKIRPISPSKPGVKMPNRTPKVTRPGGKPGMNPALPKNRPAPPKAGLDGKKGKAKTDFNKAAPPPAKRGIAGNKGRAKRDFNFAAKPPGGNHGGNNLNHNPPTPKF
ncbi:MAG: hypothetical protein V2I76_06785 [Roseobacter sp.]|jgi:hypothetical protein|nr:hypothetical protein [Roseobacter sp.]